MPRDLLSDDLGGEPEQLYCCVSREAVDFSFDALRLVAYANRGFFYRVPFVGVFLKIA